MDGPLFFFVQGGWFGGGVEGGGGRWNKGWGNWGPLEVERNVLKFRVSQILERLPGFRGLGEFHQSESATGGELENGCSFSHFGFFSPAPQNSP